MQSSQIQASRFPAVPQQDPYFAKDFFTYEVDFTTAIAAGGSASASFTIQADSDFLWTKATYSQVSAAGTPIPSILIQDTGSGRNLSTQGVPVPNLFGTGSLPFILPRQRIFVARAVVNITILNLDGANAINKLYLSFIGEKGFRSN
jgi:hypothetical protein